MSYCDTPKAKPRFKGIENFLRRIAFNLGNSPSQTEVKIISCIPIDVTDLQNKIVELERELDTLKPACETTRGPTVRTALCAPAFSPCCPTICNPSCSPVPDCDSKLRTSKTKAFLEKYCLCESDGYNEACTKASQQRVKKMGKKKGKNRTEMVYFAQTSTRSPFTNYEDQTVTSRQRAEEAETTSETFLRDVVRRQYHSEPIRGAIYATSDISSPVCRDELESATAASPLDSDMCSCCHGHFHNLDVGREPGGDIHDRPIYEVSPPRDHSVYYDSSFYDVVPVKERPTTIDEYDDNFKDVDKFVQEREYSFPVRPQYKPYNPLPPLPRHKMTYRRKLPIKFIHRRDNTVNMLHKVMLDRHKITDTSQSFSVECGQVYTKAVHGKTKPATRERPTPPSPSTHIPPVLHKNAECLTMNVNDSECQTTTSRSVQLEPQPIEENKTDITLNQIKSILHAVLTEVKTNSQIKYAVDRSPTKDAVVQKGTSQSNVCTSFLASYNPMNPYEAPFPGRSGALFRQSELLPVSAPPAPPPPKPFPPLKCIQNYPLFIQTTGRQCTCCYRNLPGGSSHAQAHLSSPDHPLHTGHALHASHAHYVGHGYREGHAYREGHLYRQGHCEGAAHTATNTDKLESNRHSKETEKLIKEIYKSLAVNAELQKESSPSSEYADIKSDKSLSNIICKNLVMKNYQAAKSKADLESEGTRQKEVSESLNTDSVRTTEESTPTTTDTSGVDQRRGREVSMEESPSPSTSTEREPRRRRAPSDREPDSASSASESEDTIITETRQKKEKKSLFSKMVNLFTKKSRRQRKDRSSSEGEPNRSDSDDYETVYIQRSAERVRRAAAAAAPRSPPAPRRAVHSKLSSARYHATRRDPNRGRRSPFLEQGHRRIWAENLVFQGSGTGSTRYSYDRRDMSGSRRRRPDPRARNMLPANVSSRPTSARTKIQGRNPEVKKSSKGLAWFKKHKCSCGEQWKSLLLEH